MLFTPYSLPELNFSCISTVRITRHASKRIADGLQPWAKLCTLSLQGCCYIAVTVHLAREVCRKCDNTRIQDDCNGRGEADLRAASTFSC